MDSDAASEVGSHHLFFVSLVYRRYYSLIKRHACILIIFSYYAVILAAATFWPVCLLEGRWAPLSAFFLDSYWWTEGKKRGEREGSGEEGGRG